MLNKLKTWTSKISLEVRYILLLFVVTRILLTIIGVSSRILLKPFLGSYYVWNYSKSLFLDIWGVWDTGWYLEVANTGYSALVHSRGPVVGQANYAFFPLYPLLARLGEKITGDLFTSGLIVSNIFLLVSCIFFYKLVKLDYSNNTALRSIKYLFIFPTAFIFSGAFTESLFLALLIMCFYFAKKQQWAYVAIAGLFLALTRSLGVIAVLPLFYIYLENINFNIRKIRYDIIFLIGLPLGLLTFMVYNYHLTGDFLAFAHIQSAWTRDFSNPIYILFKGLLSKDIYELYLAWPTLAALGFLCVFYKRIGFTYWLLGVYSIFIPLCSGLLSMPRFLLPIFPLYIILASLGKNKLVDQIFTIVLVLIQGFFFVFWANGFRLIV